MMENLIKRSYIIVFLVALCFLSNSSYANINDDSGLTYERNLVNNDVRANFSLKTMGEVYNPDTGKISFKQTDIQLPGNNELEVAVRRVFSNSGGYGFTRDFGDWSLDLPHIRLNIQWIHDTYLNAKGKYNNVLDDFCSTKFQTIFTKERGDSNFYTSTYNGAIFYTPQKGDAKIVDLNQNILKEHHEFDFLSTKATKSADVIQCYTPSNGQKIGIKVRSHDGKTYFFD